jgi:thiamine biosynthesis protein ThiI
MKRGLRCDYVHFSGRPYTGPESIYKSYAHVATLDRFQGGSRLFIVPFGVAQRRIASAGAGRLQVLTQRRLMLKVASELARREGDEALVTGDSLGQVSSQTLHNMSVVERAADLPVLRPLVAWDKAEIVREAEDIGTYAVSKLPAEDCCTLFASRLADTRAAPERLSTLEARLDLAETVAELVAAAELVRPRPGRPLPAENSAAPEPILQSTYTGDIQS